MNTRFKLILSFFVAGIYALVSDAYKIVEAPLVGAANAQQMNDTLSGYATSKLMADNAVHSSLLWIFIGILAIIWLPGIFKNMKNITIPLMMAALLTLTGCLKPVKVLDPVEIGPNETAWAIPLDAMSKDNQVKFNSVDFLNQKKVSAKRYMVDKVERQIGRFGYQIEWIPATRIIKVDRSLVTREWTDGGGTRQGIGVVTADSVQLRVGLTVTASIEEDDASTYLYYHGEKKLADVLDQNIRSFAVAELTRKYSDLTLGEAQKKGNAIYAELFADAQKAFKAKGISVQYLGNAEGLTYADQKVQESINRSYTVQQDRQTAQQEQEAAKIRNATAIMTAEATAAAASKMFAAKDASELQTELKIRQMEAEARLSMATRWDGKLPENILPSDSPLLMSLGAKRASTK